MGCVCVKPLPVDDSGEVSIEKEVNRGALDLRGSRRTSSRKGRNFQVKDKLEYGDVKVGSSDNRGNGSGWVREVHFEKKNENSEVVILEKYPGLGYFPKAVEGEQVAAGWPSWLAAVAGEAINGWLPRRADTFAKLDKIGQGTYSSVYKARDLVQNKVVALKRVRFDNMDPESVKFMAREILILHRLDHPNIIKLEGLITSQTSYSLYLVFEYMEHDLTGLASLPGVKFTEPQVKCYMQQLLSGLDHCHGRGVLHRDIKGSNLLIDDHGVLKLADFGLASFFDQAQSVPLTSRVVTLWYRPLELLLGTTHYGVEVDLWSAGCILGELYTGKPVMPGRTEVEQLHKIFKLCGSPSEEYWRKLKLPHSTGFKPIQPYRRRIVETFKDYPAAAVGLIDTLLSMEPAHRGTAASALKNEFFTTQPLACDPSSLPKYPPSKEMDAKRRDEEARRQGAARVKGARGDLEVKCTKEPQAIPAPSATAELVGPPQRKQGNSNSKNQSELFNHHKEETTSGFLIDPPRTAQAVKGPSRRVSYSGPLISGIGLTKAGKKYDDISDVATRADLSRLSGLVASRTSEDFRDRLGPSKHEAVTQVGRVSESFGEPLRSQDQKHTMQFIAGSCQVENRRFSTKEPIMPGHGCKANRIRFSGPLLAPSNNVEQMLKDHDRQIQEATRRARLEKAKVPIQELQTAAS